MGQVHAGTRMSEHKCGSHRISLGRQFFPDTLSDPEIELRSLGQCTKAASHWAILPAFFCFIVFVAWDPTRGLTYARYFATISRNKRILKTSSRETLSKDPWKKKLGVYICHPNHCDFTFIYWHIHATAHVEVRGQLLRAGPLPIACVLGITLRSLGLAARSSTHWAISPARRTKLHLLETLVGWGVSFHNTPHF